MRRFTSGYPDYSFHFLKPLSVIYSRLPIAADAILIIRGKSREGEGRVKIQHASQTRHKMFIAKGADDLIDVTAIYILSLAPSSLKR